jgi:hypothetical protein
LEPHLIPLEVIQPLPLLDPTQLLSLNCFVLGDDLKKVFTVKINKTENVSILKDLIKEKKAPHLDHVDASDLNLWNVSISMDDDVDERLKNVNNLEPLKPLLPLSQVFSRVEESHLHILIQAPTNGELIWAVLRRSDNFIDVVQRLPRSQGKRRGEIRSVLCIKVCTFSFSLAISD